MTRKRCCFTAAFKKRVALEAPREHDTVQAIRGAPRRSVLEPRIEARRGARSDDPTIRDLHSKIGELTVDRSLSARVAALSRR